MGSVRFFFQFVVLNPKWRHLINQKWNYAVAICTDILLTANKHALILFYQPNNGWKANEEIWEFTLDFMESRMTKKNIFFLTFEPFGVIWHIKNVFNVGLTTCECMKLFQSTWDCVQVSIRPLMWMVTAFFFFWSSSSASIETVIFYHRQAREKSKYTVVSSILASACWCIEFLMALGIILRLKNIFLEHFSLNKYNSVSTPGCSQVIFSVISHAIHDTRILRIKFAHIVF